MEEAGKFSNGRREWRSPENIVLVCFRQVHVFISLVVVIIILALPSSTAFTIATNSTSATSTPSTTSSTSTSTTQTPLPTSSTVANSRITESPSNTGVNTQDNLNAEQGLTIKTIYEIVWTIYEKVCEYIGGVTAFISFVAAIIKFRRGWRRHCPAPPSAPTSLTVTDVGIDSVTLKWEEPKNDGGSNRTAFIVSKCEDQTDEWHLVARLEPDKVTCTVRALPQKKFYFSVAAKNEAGEGPVVKTDKPVKLDIVSDLQHYLIELYKTRTTLTNPLTGDEKQTESQLYVEPVIRLVRQKDQNGEPVVEADAESQTENQCITFERIFSTDKKPCQNIYIAGNAGMGKTAFCKYLVNTWCKAVQTRADNGGIKHSVKEVRDMCVLKEFSLLFYVRLRDVGKYYDIEDMIKNNVLYDFKEFKVSNIPETEKCLVVLDGLDEWSTPENSKLTPDLNKNIPGRVTKKNWTYLTTTRNVKLSVINLLSKDIDKHVELCGIGQQSSEELAKNTLRQLQAEFENNSRVFFQDVQKAKIKTLTEIPILLIFLVTLWHHGYKNLGNSKVQLYYKMLEFLFEKATTILSETTSKDDKISTDINSLQSECIPECPSEKTATDNITSTDTKPVQANCLPECFSDNDDHCHKHSWLLLCLSKLAFDFLLHEKEEEKLVFHISKGNIFGINPSYIQLCLDCGILTQDIYLGNPMGRFKKLSFLHKQLQEFLAAVHLVTSKSQTAKADGHDEDSTGTKKYPDSMKEIRKYCNNLGTTLEMGQMFMFVCGMNAEVGNQLLKHLITVVAGDKRVQKYRQSIDDEDLIKDIYTCVMVCVAEAASTGLTLDVNLHDLQDHYIDKNTISDYINHVVEKKVTTIKSVYINTYDCSIEHVIAVMEHLQIVTTLEKLYLYDIAHLISDSSILASILTSNGSTLKSLCLWDTDVLHHEALFGAVWSCIPSLRALLVFDWHISPFGMDRGRRVSHSRLENLAAATLHLTHLQLSLPCCRHRLFCGLMLDLARHTKLQTLNLWSLCVTNLHVVAHSVEKVELRRVRVSHSSLKQFLKALAKSSNKVEVKLDVVTVIEDSSDPADTAAAYLRSCDKFTVMQCDIKPDKTWTVEFHKK